jgi:hypothetical protein
MIMPGSSTSHASRDHAFDGNFSWGTMQMDNRWPQQLSGSVPVYADAGFNQALMEDVNFWRATASTLQGQINHSEQLFRMLESRLDTLQTENNQLREALCNGNGVQQFSMGMWHDTNPGMI